MSNCENDLKIISAEVFGAYLNCATKSWLRAADHPPAGSAYSEWLKAQNDSYRTTERERLVTESANDEVTLSSDRENTKLGRWCLAPGLAVQVKFDSCVLENELHAVERVPAKGRERPVQFIPIRFAFKNKLARVDKLLLAFDAFVQSSETVRLEGVSYTGHGVPRLDTVSRTGQSRPHKQNTQEGGSRAHAGTRSRTLAETSVPGLSGVERISLERRLGQIQAELAETFRKKEMARSEALFAEQCRHHAALGWTEPRRPKWLDVSTEILSPENPEHEITRRGAKGVLRTRETAS